MRCIAVPALVLALSTSACTSGFHGKWREASTGKYQDPYSGRYAGEWKSTRGTHRDRLECVLTKVKPTEYTADFLAHWHGLSSSYTVRLAATSAGEGLQFKGEEDLGVLQGGVYKYKGVVTPRGLRANYDSKYDTGVFELRRVKQAGP